MENNAKVKFFETMSELWFEHQGNRFILEIAIEAAGLDLGEFCEYYAAWATREGKA